MKTQPPQTPVVEYGYDEATYHADPALSYSACKQILRSPAYYRWYQDHPRPYKPSFNFGNAIHAMLLGMGAQVVVVPRELCAKNGNVSTNAAKEWKAAAIAAGHHVVSQDEYDRIRWMADAVNDHDEARNLIGGHGTDEVSMWWNDPRTGIRCRGRADRILHDGTIVDYKSARTADPGYEGFGKVAQEYGYAIQGYSYPVGWQTANRLASPPDFVFVVQEKEPPFSVSVQEMGMAEDAAGRMLYEEAVDTYIECTKTGVWPHPYGNGRHILSLPDWAYPSDIT